MNRNALLRQSAIRAAAIVALGISNTFLSAKDLVEVSAFGSNSAGGPVVQSARAGGDSIPNIVDALINREEEFSAVNSSPFITANLDALGVRNVLVIDLEETPGVVIARLRSGITDLDESFSGTTRDEVEDEIEEFLKNRGSEEVAKILKALNEDSPLAPMAGNPSSSASLIAQDIFSDYGFPESRTNAERESGEKHSGFGIGLTGDAGIIEANGYKARSFSLTIPLRIYEARRWAIDFKLPLNYTTIEGADIFRVGLTLGVPIVILEDKDESPWFWQVTPSVGSQATASIDLVNGGVINNGSLSSALEYKLGPDFKNISLAMGNQITFLESMEIGAGGYSFDPNISAQILKNGLRVSLPFAQSWVWDVYFVDTRFLGDASYASGYETVGTALGFKPRAEGGYAMVGTYANFAKDYSSINFQLGTGWNF